MARDEGGEVVEEVLAVVEVEDGETAGWIREVRFGEVDGDAALVRFWEDGGVEVVAFEAWDVGDARRGNGVGIGVFGLFRREIFTDEEAGIGWDVAC